VRVDLDLVGGASAKLPSARQVCPLRVRVFDPVTHLGLGLREGFVPSDIGQYRVLIRDIHFLDPFQRSAQEMPAKDRQVPPFEQQMAISEVITDM
jgi:hypothetical protein